MSILTISLVYGWHWVGCLLSFVAAIVLRCAARAVLKNAPLLILDEAAANLDPLTEQAVLNALNVLMQGRTTLMMTHRLVAMEQMDEILVLDHGRIIERGSHDHLLMEDGLYRQM